MELESQQRVCYEAIGSNAFKFFFFKRNAAAWFPRQITEQSNELLFYVPPTFQKYF